jgi:DNA helicase IV
MRARSHVGSALAAVTGPGRHVGVDPRLAASPAPVTPSGLEPLGVPDEQQVIDRAYLALDAMRERANAALETAKLDAKLTDAVDSAAIQAVLAARVNAVADSKAPLTFGRIAGDGEAFYIGRRHVENANGDALVVDWRAGVAAPFYRATWVDPLGLDHRRRFALDARTLVGVFDEDFTSDEQQEGGSGGIPDPLLAELDRARSGSMRDIVATIQAEQDIVIRLPLDSLAVVQGGPGTGKTAVGLHRAAFLLYTNREHFERRKMLVVGPNRLFLAYISDVLPSLGETSVVQATVEILNSRVFPVRATEPASVAALKGDRRMAVVIERAISARISLTDTIRGGPDFEFMTSFGGVQVPAPDVASVLEDVAARQLPLNTAREVLREQLVAMAWRMRAQRSDVSPEQQFLFVDDLRKQTSFRSTIDKMWPTLAAPSVLRKLLGSLASLRAAANGLYDDAELRMLVRKQAAKASDEKWTRADVALLDEINDRVAGDTPQFGHVVIDEAQDLSAMELRMVARRSPGRSLTILGDLAQSTTPWGQDSWTAVITELGHQRPDARGRSNEPVSGAVHRLTVGYRVPAQLVEFANRLLPTAAPEVDPLSSVREGPADAEIVTCTDNQLTATVVLTATRLLELCGLVGVLVPTALVEVTVEAFRSAGVSAADARSNTKLDEGISIIAAELAKGLEFDAVVVVEPAQIIGDHPGGTQRGYRTLFVALTRATQRVAVVHAQPLPLELVNPEPAARMS